MTRCIRPKRNNQMSNCLYLLFHLCGRRQRRTVEIAGECRCESHRRGWQRRTWLVKQEVREKSSKSIGRRIGETTEASLVHGLG